ncbi:MAG TPA: polymer-forming cytoskeletal protein [Myxococcaceae bacterium]|jgi:hypothetical protein
MRLTCRHVLLALGPLAAACPAPAPEPARAAPPAKASAAPADHPSQAFWSNRNNNTARSLRSPPRAPLPPFTVLALERVELAHGASVHGSVAVRTQVAGSGEELQLGPEALVEGDAFANRVRLQPRAHIAGTVHENYLTLAPGASVTASVSPLALPLDVDVPVVSVDTGGADVDAAGEVVLPSGRYRDARVAPGGVLRLSGGSYAFRSIHLQPGARVECAARCQAGIAADLELGARSSFGPMAGSGLDAAGVEVEVMGACVRLGERAALRAVFAAPGADLHAGARSSLAGRFMARSVELDEGATAAAEAPASVARLEATVLPQSRMPGKE